MGTTVHIPDLGSLKIEVKLKGNWVEATKLPSRVANAMRKGYDEGVNKFSARFLKTINQAITTGVPPKGSGVKWDPLSPKTLKRYGAHTPYLLTGLYRHSIKEFKSKTRHYIGMSKSKASGGKMSPDSNLTLSQLARLLEYGNDEGAGSGIPPRPLWGPTLKSVGGKQRLKKYILDSVRSRLSARGIRIRTI